MDVDDVIGGGGCGWTGADSPDVDEAGEEGRGRAEQKGRLKWSMSSWRATLFRWLGMRRESKKRTWEDTRTCVDSDGPPGWR